MSDDLQHYGTPRHSGRYPWGSGDDPYQRNTSFVGHVQKLKKQGVKETEIARAMGMNTTALRKRLSLADSEIRAYEASEAMKLRDKGYSYSAIGRRMGKNESSVRLLCNPVLKKRSEATTNNAQILKDEVDKKGYIDVTKGTEQFLGITQGRMSNAVALLEREGYPVHTLYFEQLGTGKNTTMKVLCRPGTEWKELNANRDKIGFPLESYSEDGGKTLRKFEPPKSIDSKRVAIRYAEDGGTDKDGVIELRRGVEDISLGNAKYAQVRIAVDGTHYIKGMAMHSDDLPAGTDILFNTNKTKDVPMMGDDKNNTVLKLMDQANPENPFGASIRGDDKLLRFQRHYTDKDGAEQLSVLNVVNEEGNWNQWSKNLASQMLSKQSPGLAKQQLDIAHSIAKEEFDEIMALTNPTVKATLLNKFADQCDSDATHLQAAALPRQATKVILPVPELPDSEIYAPGYRDGEHVALVRFPHGGTFEIPTLTVNNKQAVAKAALGEAIDAVGIHPKTAARLSGADFDGDTVLVLPIDNVKLRTSPPLKGLQNFDPHEEYRGYEGMPEMTDRKKGLEMGKVSNLITDMTIKGANEDELARAVRHSMVVIDAKKHNLDYRRSEIDHNIAELKDKYQGSPTAGAATLLSRSTSDVRINQRREKAVRNMTMEELAAYKEGKTIYENTGKTYMKGKTLKSGEVRFKEKSRQEEVPRMMLEEDAFNLVSGGRTNTTRIEAVYATHANSMKALAQAARKEARRDLDIPYSPSARQTYAEEVAALKAELNLAKRNAPLERKAQLIANKSVATKKHNNPEMDHEHLKRLKGQELDAARKRVGAKKHTIKITDRQWEAINAGAITKTFLRDIMDNADLDRIRELATPRANKGLSPGKLSRARSLLANGHTQSDVADVLGVSVSTLVNSIGVDKF